MICYRVVRRKYDNLSGQGAKLFGGRFNPPGIPAVYSSQSIALAVLEVLAGVYCLRYRQGDKGLCSEVFTSCEWYYPRWVICS